MRRESEPRSFPLLRRRVGLVARILCLSVGGYGLAAASAFALARGLPASRAEAATAASLVAVLVMPAAAVWAFAAPRAWLAVAGIFGLAGMLALIAWLLGQPG
jgi:hypothetical protein